MHAQTTTRHKGLWRASETYVHDPESIHAVEPAELPPDCGKQAKAYNCLAQMIRPNPK